MNLYDFLFVLIVLALYVIKDFIHEARTSKMQDRWMAKSLGEFKYYQDKYQGDLKELERVREEAHKGEDLVETELRRAVEPEVESFEEGDFFDDEEPPKKK